jgi:hypothetical protein
MKTKYLNIALILALVVAAGVTKHYTPSDAQQAAATRTAAIAPLSQMPN